MKMRNFLKTIAVAATVMSALFFSLHANAALINKNFQWTGDAGFTAKGTFIYDDSFATVTASGLGATNGLEEFEVSFFDPANTLLGSFVNVTGGVSTSYSFLTVTFNTATMQFEDLFDFGADTGSPGEFFVGGIIGDFSALQQVRGTSTPQLIDINSGSGAVITVTSAASVPEPGTLALFGLGLAGLAFARRKRAA